MARRAKPFSQIMRRNTELARIRLEAVFKNSVQSVLEDASIPTAQGGNMRVDTGFLRNSLTVSLDAPAAGPSNPKTDAQGSAEASILMVSGATVNNVIWAGWSANYASAREYRDGFREAAIQRWPAIVRANVERAKKEIK